MALLEFNTDPAVTEVFNNYPEQAKPKMLALRDLVLETARQTEGVTKVEETLKWGEPSYRSNIGSTLRLDWKAKTPQQYALYFQCNSRLVSTFRLLFKNTLSFEGKRAIVFNLEEELPTEAVKHCIKAALTYHQVKHLPSLGI